MPGSTPDGRPLAAATLVTLLGRPGAEAGAPLNTPIVLGSTYRADGDVAYGRDGNPTVAALEHALGVIEGGDCLAFSSGMSAVAAVLETLPGGAIVVAPRVCYFGVGVLLRDRAKVGRLVVRTVDTAAPDEVIAALDGAALLWLETPTNPLLGIADLRTLIDAARSRNVLVVVDNTIATPLRQQPLALGATAAMHSVTKFIGGHSDFLLGAVISADPAFSAALAQRRGIDGGIPGPLEAYLALRGLRTLAVRLDRAEQNATELAQRLVGHPRVTRVHYPGLSDHPGYEIARSQSSGPGAVLSFEIDGTGEDAEAVCNGTRLIVHATSLGGVETLIERRARYESEVAAGTPATLLRVSVGIEDIDDIWRDLEQALALDR
jgi:cystathionine gamma-synthase